MDHEFLLFVVLCGSSDFVVPCAVPFFRFLVGRVVRLARFVFCSLVRFVSFVACVVTRFVRFVDSRVVRLSKVNCSFGYAVHYFCCLLGCVVY